MSRQGWASQLLSVMAWIRMVVEYRVDNEHNGCESSERSAPTLVLPYRNASKRTWPSRMLTERGRPGPVLWPV